MSRLTAVLFSTCLIGAAPAWADIRAEDVWNEWQSLADLTGVTLKTDAVNRIGNGLVILGLKVSYKPFDGVDFEIGTPEITLTTNNGIVTISNPAPYVFKTNYGIGPDQSVTSSGQVTYKGRSVTASGTPDAIRYDYQFDEALIEIETTDASTLGTTQSTTIQQIFGATGFIENLPGTAESPAKGAYAIETLTITSDTGPEPFVAKSIAKIANMAVAAKFHLTDHPHIPLTLTATASAESVEQDVAAMMPDGGFTASSKSNALGYDVTLDDTKLALSTNVEDTSLDLTVVGAPVPPLSMLVEQIDLSFDLPLQFDGTKSPFALELGLKGLTVDETVWAMFDPNKHVSRDPAELTIDLSGDIHGLTLDNILANLNGAIAPSSTDLSIDRLRLGFGGAMLTGSGAFTFKPGPTPEQPEAEGSASFALDNGMALLRGLVQAGVVPQEQLMGMQMMLGMIARPDGDGDRLVSEIDVGPGQRLVVNGVQIR